MTTIRKRISDTRRDKNIIGFQRTERYSVEEKEDKIQNMKDRARILIIPLMYSIDLGKSI